MRRMLALLALAGISGPATSLAQLPPDPPPTSITLRPEAEPRPALKYRLLPERGKLTPGNAAICYHRAVLMVNERLTSQARRDKDEPKPHAPSTEQQISNWNNAPLSQVPRDQARTVLEPFQDALKEVELGATRSTCDWEFDQRADGFSLQIPEIQGTRTLARMIVLKTRLAILDGKTDEAMHWIETGLVLGQHVSMGPILVQSLVGIAIDNQVIRCLEDLVQAPGTPSLYWALADRPRPMIDMRHPMEWEKDFLEREFPGFKELDRGPWSLDQARKFSDELQSKLYALLGGESFPGSDAAIPIGVVLSRRIGVAAMAAKIYPEARRTLIAQGRPEAEVDAMPIIQVSTLYTYQEFRHLRDESYKWMNLPYWQSYNRVDRADLNTVEKKMANPLLALFRALMPAMNSVRVAGVQCERRFDALQCVEAIRLYAAAHDGKLPASLDSIQEAPVPLDPATGKSFEYKVDGDSATLSAPVIPGGPSHPSYKIRYLLKLAK